MDNNEKTVLESIENEIDRRLMAIKILRRKLDLAEKQVINFKVSDTGQPNDFLKKRLDRLDKSISRIDLEIDKKFNVTMNKNNQDNILDSDQELNSTIIVSVTDAPGNNSELNEEIKSVNFMGILKQRSIEVYRTVNNYVKAILKTSK